MTRVPSAGDLVAAIDSLVAAEMARVAPRLAGEAVAVALALAREELDRRVREARRAADVAGRAGEDAGPRPTQRALWASIRRTGDVRPGRRLTVEAEVARVVHRARHALAGSWWQSFAAETLNPDPIPSPLDPLVRLQVDPADPFLLAFRDLLAKRRGNIFRDAVKQLVADVAAGAVALEGHRAGTETLALEAVPQAILATRLWIIERRGPATTTPTLTFTGQEPSPKWDRLQIASAEAATTPRAVDKAPPSVDPPHPQPATPAKPKRGNPSPPRVDYREHDQPLIAEMKSLIDDNKARGAMDAARAVADRAKGFGSQDSKVKRLAQGFKAQYTTDHG